MLKKKFPGTKFSSVYRSKALGFTDQADFLNAAAVFDTKLTPEKVSTALKGIEKKLKKKVTRRFGPRTIDLDLLLYGKEIRLEDELTIPHLRIHKRRFVLEPLLELGAGNLSHPGLDRKLKSYVPEVKHQECKKTKLRL